MIDPLIQRNYGLSVGDPADVPPLSFDAAEAAAYLNRQMYAWNGNTDPENPKNHLGEDVTLSYAFRKTDGNYSHPGDAGSFSQFSSTQMGIAEYALQSWADVANITFNRVGTGTTGAQAYSDNASVLFGNIENSAGAAYAYLPRGPKQEGSGYPDGDVYVNVNSNGMANPQLWAYGALALTHEIGHALGLKHPGDYNASNGGPITYDDDADYIQDSKQYTVMSYFSEQETGADYNGSYSIGPMMHDIAAMQRLYGANMESMTGDTVYGFNSNTDRVWYTASTALQPLIFTAWDAGGNDTFDFSGYFRGSVISLKNESFSSVNGMKYNIAISAAVYDEDNHVVNIIENAIGGTKNDTITGNDAANRLEGRDGNDKLNGGKGADVIIGGLGKDQLAGAGGSDRFDFDSVTESTPGANADLIKDLANSDIIDLSTIDADTTLAGNQAFHLGGAAFNNQKGELIVRVSGGQTFIEGDTDGDGDADISILAKGAHADYDNFVL